MIKQINLMIEVKNIPLGKMMELGNALIELQEKFGEYMSDIKSGALIIIDKDGKELRF